MHRSILIYVLLSLFPFAGSLAFAGQREITEAPEILSDSTSCWKGFTRYHFEIEGRPAFITAPDKRTESKEWVWRARFPEWHTEMDEILLDAGIYIAYINTDNMFGSPRAMKLWDAFYTYLVQELGFAPKLSLEGVSRGGLFVFSWAKRHPWKVHSIYTEAPVCDFKSWPGGRGAGEGDRESWILLKKEYGFLSENEALFYQDNPLEKLESLAEAKVPILAMIGLQDRVVPPSENIFLLSDRYVKAGGSSTLIPCTRGEEELSGHHFSIETPELGAAFILSHINRPLLPLASRAYHRAGSGLGNSLAKFEREKEGIVAFLGGSITQNGGWRDSVCVYLQQRFPDTRFKFIPAGIASMGSTPGAFRLHRDVLSQGPVDLLFVEAAVNDATNGRSTKEQIRGMEGIIRHALTANRTTDILVMHFADPDKTDTYNRGEIPEVIQNFEAVCAHYKIGSINLAKEVTQRINNGEFTWEDDFKDLHPSPFGQGVYFRSIKRFLENQYAEPSEENSIDIRHALPEPLDPYCYDQGRMVPVEEAGATEGFELIRNWVPPMEAGTRQGYTQVDMLVGDHPGDSFTFSFEGKAVGIMVAAGPDAGTIEFRIDGGNIQRINLFTPWSKMLYLPWYYTLAAELEPESHTLWVRISEERDANSAGHSCIIKSFYVN
jgi:sialidase-1